MCIIVLIIHHPSMCLSPTNCLHLESKKILILLPDNITDKITERNGDEKEKKIVHVLVFCTEKTGTITT